MKSRPFARACRWLNLPTGVLVALLQRSPALKVVAALGEYVLASPAGTVLKGALTAAASLGAVNSMAGATTLSATPASPLSATVGTPVTAAIGIAGTTSAPESWTIAGTVPDGLAFYTSNTATTGGVTTGSIRAATIYLKGTPTTAGSFTINLRAFNENPNVSSGTLPYIVNVAAASTTPPAITTQPTAQATTVGSTVMFSVVASGTGLSYQWQKDGAAISGATSATLTLTNVQVSNAGNYAVVVTNSGGSVTSSSVMLTVTTAGAGPTITVNPISQTAPGGSNVAFTVAASGTGLTYQWQRNGTNISGANSATLNLSNIQDANAGDYTVVVTNNSGSTTSFPATLLVGNPVAGRLINLSVRTTSGTGANVLIAGFIISGNGNKPVVIRGTAQSLAVAPFNVPGVLSNPIIELQPTSASAPIATNDSWQSTPNLAAISALGLDKLGSSLLDSRDTLLMQTLSAGGYTVKISDVGGGSGIGLVEAFDADSTAPGAPGFDTQPKLINLSARAQVNTGAGVLIAGFIINGSAPKKLLIRGIGASLSQFSVPGVLTDAKLQLVRQSDGKIFGENDNWQTTPNVAEITAAGDDKITPSSTLDARDAVLLVTLPPGGYTAIVSGVGSATGVALVDLSER